MYTGDDRELGMGRNINRRDFLNGMGVAVTGASLLPIEVEAFARLLRQEGLMQQPQEYYPPTLTGMRGSHPGSFEVAHSLRDGARFDDAPDSGERYDMVVVGAGLSGLASAYFFHTAAGRNSRVLILDNHDDFGGHAKRNEFWHEGQMLLLNGGTSNLEAVDHYSTVSRTLLKAIGVDFARLEAASNMTGEHYSSMNLGSGTFFCREVFGQDRLVPGSPGGRGRGSADGAAALKEWLAKTPLSPAAQRDLARLYDDQGQPDYMAGLSDADKKDRLARMSYKDFLLTVAKADPGVIPFLDDRPKGLFAVGIDAFPALYAFNSGYPGFQGMDLEPFPKVGPLAYIGGGQHGRENPFASGPTIEFPDGNASIARLLVRQLIPDAVPGSTMEDVITARVNYGRLDRADAPVRLRLNSTAVRVRHLGNPDTAKEVEVTYVRGGKAEKVRAEHVVLGCWNGIVPHLCPELSQEQKQALAYGVKLPFVYTSVLVRDWTAFTKLGMRSVNCPGMYHTGFSLGRVPVMGDYRPPRAPEQPMVLHMTRTPCAPGKPKREQHRIGRADLLSTTFETFERNIRDQIARGLAGTGFDPARDIAAITVNRWPHGYAYAYSTLDDGIEWSLLDPDDRPCIVGRQRFGRISIGNSDAAASSHTDAAIDEGHRAVREQLVVRSRSRQPTVSAEAR